jgi:hypothetical protein
MDFFRVDFIIRFNYKFVLLGNSSTFAERVGDGTSSVIVRVTALAVAGSVFFVFAIERVTRLALATVHAFVTLLGIAKDAILAVGGGVASDNIFTYHITKHLRVEGQQAVALDFFDVEIVTKVFFFVEDARQETFTDSGLGIFAAAEADTFLLGAVSNQYSITVRDGRKVAVFADVGERKARSRMSISWSGRRRFARRGGRLGAAWNRGTTMGFESFSRSRRSRR